MLRFTCMVVVAALAVLARTRGAAAQTVTVNFDSATAECTFAAQTAPISNYVPPTVTITSATLEVLDQCGGFAVSGHSAPNFLAWSSGAASATVTFATPVRNLSIRAGSQNPGSATVQAFDAAGGSLGTVTHALARSLVTFTLPYAGIARLTLSSTASAGVWDDLTFTADICGDGVLDAGEECDDGNGEAGDCCSPSCTFEPAGTVCRAAAGACDVAEACTGSSAACPADAFADASVECRASAGVCDVAEACTGSSAACPADAFADASVECRASVGLCDAAEVCTGTSAECPADAFAPSGTVCRPSTGACDLAETCSGAATECPPDGPALPGCRDAGMLSDDAGVNDATDDGGLPTDPPPRVGNPGCVCSAAGASGFERGAYAVGLALGLVMLRRRRRRR